MVNSKFWLLHPRGVIMISKILNKFLFDTGTQNYRVLTKMSEIVRCNENKRTYLYQNWLLDAW